MSWSSPMACELTLSLDNCDSLRRSSGGKLSGCVSGSYLAAADELLRWLLLDLVDRDLFVEEVAALFAMFALALAPADFFSRNDEDVDVDVREDNGR